MRRFLLFLTIFLFAACAPKPAAATPPPPATQPSPFPHAEEIRFALIGYPRDWNVWALYGKADVSYADLALRDGDWTRLFDLNPLDLSPRPRAAQTLPAGFTQMGDFFSASVSLRPDLVWSDGTSLTAEDVSFTANTALAFELGLQWGVQYPHESILQARALDAHTVEFIFKQPPNTATWQYGVLQGRLTQKKFWQPKLSEASALLPTQALKSQILAAQLKLEEAQGDVERLSDQLIAIQAAGQGNRPLEIELEHRQRELGFAKNSLEELEEQYANAVNAAQAALFSISAPDEPTLGAWRLQSRDSSGAVKTANADFPLGVPAFERAVYYFYPNEDEAMQAYQREQVDFVLQPEGSLQPEGDAKTYPTYRARFLFFRATDSAFRRALGCLIHPETLTQNILQGKAAALESLIMSPFWRGESPQTPCSGMTPPQREERARQILSDAGYTWRGESLLQPNGFPLKLTLLAPLPKVDELRNAAALYIAEQARSLGADFSVKETTLDEIIYAVYSSRKYDAALLGWRLGEHPGYLCDWAREFSELDAGRLCAQFESDANLESARQTLLQVERQILLDGEILPLYIETRAEFYRGLAYPSASVWNGWGSWYGSPADAMPAP